MKKTCCQVCQGLCSDMAKRFDPVLRFICPDCHDFLLGADKTLRKVGIEGLTLHPTRFKPQTETP